MNTNVKRVWGKADSISLEFDYKGKEQWETTVPPDTKDGVYAVELWAINGAGELGYWAGELFMCDGVCCIEIQQSGFQIWIQPRKRQLELLDRRQLIVRKGCCHV